MTWLLFAALLAGCLVAWLVWCLALKAEDRLMDWVDENSMRPRR